MWALPLLLLSSIVTGAPVANSLPDVSVQPDSHRAQKVECKVIKEIVTIFGEQAKATSFCSSYLSITDKTTTSVVGYSTSYVTVTLTGNAITTTETAQAVTTTDTITTTTTAADVTSTTTVTTSEGVTTTNIGLVTCGSPQTLLMRRNALPTLAERVPQPVASPPTTLLAVAQAASPSKPSCFKGFTDKGIISSACSCLSIPTGTSTVSKTSTVSVYSTTTIYPTVTSTVTPTSTVTSTVTSTQAGTTSMVTSTTTVPATTVTAAQGVSTPARFKIFTFSNTGASSVTYAKSSAAASNAASQLERIIFSATMSPSVYTFANGTTYVYDVQSGLTLVSLNSTSNYTSNTTYPNPPNCNGTSTYNGTYNGTHNGTNPNNGTCNGTSTDPVSSGPDYGVKLDDYKHANSKEQPLVCNVVPVVIGKGYGCKLVCKSYGSRVTNQLGPNGEWILDNALDQGNTPFTPFIEAI